MAEIILVTGGSRSGKSSYTQTRAEADAREKLYIATSPKTDPEMESRISRHIRERRGRNWTTVEEEINIAETIARNHAFNTILVDCLTLWINNLQYRAEIAGERIDEDIIQLSCEELIHAGKEHPGRIFFVTNELGSGIVPENQIARRYRDLVGSCNQLMAAKADEVILVSCGLPLTLKSPNQ